MSFTSPLYSKSLGWTELRPLKIKRHSHIAFKLENVVYVAGGLNGDTLLSSCEEYDLEKKKWKMSHHALPYPLFGPVVDIDLNGKYAIIAGGNIGLKTTTNNVIIF